MDLYVLVLGSQSVYAARWAQLRPATVKMPDGVAGPGAGHLAARLLQAVRCSAVLFQRFPKGNLLYGLPRLHYARDDLQTPWALRLIQCTDPELFNHPEEVPVRIIQQYVHRRAAHKQLPRHGPCPATLESSVA